MSTEAPVGIFNKFKRSGLLSTGLEELSDRENALLSKVGFGRLFTSSVAILILFLLAPIVLSAELSPGDVYMQYHKAMLSAESISALTSYLSKKSVGEIEKTPAEQAPVLFGLMKDLTPKNVKVTGEKIDGETAILTIGVDNSAEHTDPKTAEHTSGSVRLVKEDGAWKVDQESWSSQITSTASPPGMADSQLAAPSGGNDATKSGAKSPAKRGADEATAAPLDPARKGD